MNILDLPNYNITNTDESDYDYTFTAEVTTPPSYCPKCGCTANLYRYSRKNQYYMDTPMHGKRVGIWIKRQRYMCRDCYATFMEELPDIDDKRKATKRLVDYIETHSLTKTFTSIASEVGVDEKTVRNIFHDYVKHLQKHIKFGTPVYLGIDEAHLLHNYRCVITNVKDNAVVEILANRNKPTVVKYLSSLEDKEKIQAVYMDMWNPYRDAVNTVLPGIKIVIDRYHVVQMANKSLEKVRLNTRKDLPKNQRRTLMHDKYTLLKRRDKLDTQDMLKLESWVGKFPLLGAAYNFKEDFFDIYNSSTKEEAIERYKALIATVPPEIRKVYEDLFTSMRNWHTEIFNYFDCPVTNAYTEALNGLIKIVNRNGRGYSFDVLRTKILFTEWISHMKPPPKHKRGVCSSGGDVDLDEYWSYDWKQNEMYTSGARFSTFERLIKEGLF